VHYRSETPNVKIENPADGTKYNIAGGNGYQMDSDGSSPSICNTNIDVACSELDKPVELHRGDPGATVFATANCVAPGSGDPELPAGGFNGRAKFSNVAFLVPGSDSVTIVATQTVSGSSSDTLVGMSAVDLEGRCTAPSISWDQGCPPAQIEIPQGGGTVNYPVLQANYSGTASAAPTSAMLTVTGSSSGPISGSPHSATYDATNHWFRFTSVLYGSTAEDITSTFTATDQYENTSTIQCTSKLVVDLPTLTVSGPADNSSFEPGDGCTPSGSSNYGVRFNYMIDQTAMRTLVYQVGSDPEANVPLSALSNNVCVPVAEGTNTVKLTLRSASGGSAEATRHVTVRSLVLTAPTLPNGQTEVGISTDQCGSAITGSKNVHVTAQVDPIHNGKAVTFTGGTTSPPIQVASGTIDACVPVSQGQHTLTVSITGTTASAQVNVVIITTAPTFDIPITGRTLPSAANYRSGAVNLAWNSNMGDWVWPTQLQSYELHCASTELLASASDNDKNAWWTTTSHNVALPSDLKPPTSTANIPALHIGQTEYCVMRGADAAGGLTALTASTGSFTVDYPFRTKAVVPAVDELASMGFGLAQIGDVNGDGHDDVLVGGLGISGGTGRAYLYFGGATPDDLSNTPDVTIVGGNAGPDFLEFGSRVAGIGDFNQDGRPDFAIGYPGYSSTSPNLTRSGAVYVFYGRTSDDAWDDTIDVTTTCAADVCFFGDENLENFGYAISPAGKFDDNNFADLAVSAIGHDVGADTSAGRLYVLLNNAYASGTSVRVPGDDPVGFYVDASGATAGGNASTQFGQAIAPVGNVDGNTGDDVLVTSAGDGASVPARLFELTGRAHNRQSPQLKPIQTSALVFKDSGTSGVYGLQLTPLRNLADRGGKTNVADVAVYMGSDQPHVFYVYYGDDDFASGSRVTVIGDAGTGFGNSISSTYNPGLGNNSPGDLNGDSHDELLVAGGYPNANPAQSFIFYSDVTTPILETQSSNQLYVSEATECGPAGDADSLARYVQYVGDMTGDGAPDIVVSDPFSNGSRGSLTILY
jgi:hypothetical protein